jgi:hypothetical protein
METEGCRHDRNARVSRDRKALREHISTIKRKIRLIERHLEEGMNHLAAIVQRRLES